MRLVFNYYFLLVVALFLFGGCNGEEEGFESGDLRRTLPSPQTLLFFSVDQNGADLFNQEGYQLDDLNIEVKINDAFESLSATDVWKLELNGGSAFGIPVIPQDKDSEISEILLDYGNGDFDTLVLSNSSRFIDVYVNLLDIEMEVVFNEKRQAILDFMNTNVGSKLWERNTIFFDKPLSEIDFEQPYIIPLGKE